MSSTPTSTFASSVDAITLVHADRAAITLLPASRKVYVTGSRNDIRVPLREITQIPTQTSSGEEPNPPLYVYDTSGPYADPDVQVDIHLGLEPLREGWIDARDDTEPLTMLSSRYGRERADGPALHLCALNVTERHAGPKRAVTSPNCIMHAKASSHPRWNLSHCVRTRTRTRSGKRYGTRRNWLGSTPALPLVRQCRKRLHRSSSVARSLVATRSFRPTSTIPSLSR